MAAYVLQFVRVSVSKHLFRAEVAQPCCHCLTGKGDLVCLVVIMILKLSIMVVKAVPHRLPKWLLESGRESMVGHRFS